MTIRRDILHFFGPFLFGLGLSKILMKAGFSIGDFDFWGVFLFVVTGLSIWIQERREQ